MIQWDLLFFTYIYIPVPYQDYMVSISFNQNVIALQMNFLLSERFHVKEGSTNFPPLYCDKVGVYSCFARNN